MIEDQDAEAMVIGASLYPNDGYRDAEKFCRPDDFRNHHLAKVFTIIGDLNRDGVVADPGTVSAEFAKYEIPGSALTTADLWNMQTMAGAGATAEFWALKVHDRARRQRTYMALTSAKQNLENEAVTMDDTLRQLSDSMHELMSDTVSERIDPRLLLEILSEGPEEEDYDWLVPGLLERGDRMVVTGGEGFGKTTWLRQLAIMLAAGLHPITNAKMEPLRVMYIDPENSKVQWRREVRGIAKTCSLRGVANPQHNLRLANTPRLNLVMGHDLAKIHRLIDDFSPEILFIGPLYKLTSGSLNNEDDAAALINALDSIRDRGVVLIMEAHAAKGSGFGERNWTPRGSNALAAWPEFGMALVPDPDDEDGCLVHRWRGDRDQKRIWPKKMVKGSVLPWLPAD